MHAIVHLIQIYLLFQFIEQQQYWKTA